MRDPGPGARDRRGSGGESFGVLVWAGRGVPVVRLQENLKYKLVGPDGLWIDSKWSRPVEVVEESLNRESC